MSNRRRRAFITRAGVVSPIGNSVDDFARRLFAGESGIGQLTRFGEPEFEWFKLDEPLPVNAAGQVEQPELKSLPSRHRNRVGRFTKYSIAAMEQAFDPGIFTGKEDQYKAGVIMGTGAGGQEEAEQVLERILRTRKPKADAFAVCRKMPNCCSGKQAQLFAWKDYVGSELKLRGANFTVSSACASGANAIGEAADKVRYGRLDIAFGGGAEALITPVSIISFYSGRMLSSAGVSRPFDAERDGFVMGEGAGIVCIESDSHVLNRFAESEILAEIVGYGATDDAYHDTAPHPDAEGQAMAMRMALDDAGIKPGDIGYINAHGTSTKLNDAAETKAIKEVFGRRAYEIPVSSTKSQIGHTIGAAGALELVACVLALRNRRIPPTINYHAKDTDCDLDYVPNEPREAPGLEYAMSNSFGFTGHNVCLVLKASPYKR